MVGDDGQRLPLVSAELLQQLGEYVQQLHAEYLQTPLSKGDSWVCEILPGKTRANSFYILVGFADLRDVMT